MIGSEQDWLFQNSPLPMWIFDQDSLRFLAVNDAAVRMYGYSRTEFLRMTIREIRPSEAVAALEAYRRDLRELGHDPATGFTRAGVWRHRKKDGETIDVEIAWSRLRFEGREAILVIAYDVTAQRRAEEALRQSQAHYESLINSMDGIVWEADAVTWRFTFVSRQAERILGYSVDRWLNEPTFWEDHIHPDDRDWVIAYCAAQSQQSTKYAFEYRMIAADGRTVWLRDVVAVEWVDERPRLLRGVMLDITDRKELEGQLQQSQKMEAIGLLAAGIAHDFNNLLTVINGHGELLLAMIPKGSDLLESVTAILEAGQRAQQLTYQLLAFGRKQLLRPRVLDLNAVIERTLAMLRRLLGEPIRLLTELAAQGAVVKADPGQLEQVLVNLAVNARDAMPDGGTLTIKTAIQEVTETNRENSVIVPGPYVVLTVEDTGIGMDRRTQARIFDPFFTTKPTGRGSGLGLSVTYGIIKQSGGFIFVESQVGRGTVFRIYLPRVFESVQPDAPEVQSVLAREPAGAAATVLVVEDDPAVRRLMVGVLRQAGYIVWEARGPREADRLTSHHTGALDLLVTDVVMPDMNGRELADLLRIKYPNLKVLYTSGYTDDAVLRFGVSQATASLLRKPFTIASLLAKVRECLGHPPGGLSPQPEER